MTDHSSLQPAASVTTELVARLEAATAGSRELDYAIKEWLEFDDYWRLRVAADWTTSLDAALALAERVLPGWDWLLRNDAERGFMLNCWRQGDEPNLGDDCYPSYAPTPALALCISILKAKTAIEADPVGTKAVGRSEPLPPQPAIGDE